MTSCCHLGLPEFVFNALFSVCAVTEIENVALWFIKWLSPSSVLIESSHSPGRQRKQMLLTQFTDGETDMQREKMSQPRP